MQPRQNVQLHVAQECAPRLRASLLVGRPQLGLDAKLHISRKHLQILRRGGLWYARRLSFNPAKLRHAGGGGDIDIGGAGKPTSETVEPMA